MVLLDVGYGRGDAVELSAWSCGGNFTAEGIRAGFQLHSFHSDLFRVAGDLLDCIENG
jgi:hypothetical protein